MVAPHYLPCARRWSGLAPALVLALALAACAQTPPVQYTPPPLIGSGYPATLGVLEPRPQEIVVVVNSNVKMMHAGMFAADALLDPAGSYAHSRGLAADWKGVSLQDYVRFQLDDGPAVKLYRFSLPHEPFAQIKSRLETAERTLPLFCAARVQNILSGIEPFAAVPDAWLVLPSTLANHLDAIIRANPETGACFWPNGASCYPPAPDAGPVVALE